MIVKEIMKRPFVVDKDISLAEAAGMMSNKGIGSLVFMSGNKIKGIVTESDLVKSFGKHEKISKICSTKVTTIKSEDSLDKALEIMRAKKIKRLPVVDSDKLAGIITLTDIMANFESLDGDFFFG